jgi:predicted PurR-regulated permease PerM
MELKNFNVNFFFFALVGISVVTFFIFQPFFIAILLAAIFAIIFQTPFKFFLRLTRGKIKTSALLTSLFGIAIFVGVFIFIAGLVVSEVSTIYQNFNADSFFSGTNGVDAAINTINSNKVLHYLGVDNLINKDIVAKSITQITQFIVMIFQKTYQSVVGILFTTFIVFFTLYYFLIHGEKLVDRLMFLSPLKNAHEKLLIDRFVSMSRATIKGTLVIGFIQGALGGILFAIVGLSSPIIWGIVMMFLSLIPMFGSGLVWFPAAIILLLLGKIWQGVTVLLVGMLIISTIDNVLKPKLVGKDTQMHPLVVLFATLGGITLLGFLGFIIGPIIVALFLTLWHIYEIEFTRQLKKYNK